MFPNMTEIIPEGKKGDVEITHFEINKTQSLMTMLNHYAGVTYCEEGKYCRLVIGNKVVMSDTRMERNFNWDIVDKANGKVLLAGLGLGMVLIPILKKPEVPQVVVIERNRNVIDLVYPHVKNSKLHLIQGDIFEWVPKKGVKFDTIYFDIWNRICEDNLPEMRKLHHKFKYYLNHSNPNKYMESWSRWYLRRERANDRRRSNRWGW